MAVAIVLLLPLQAFDLLLGAAQLLFALLACALLRSHLPRTHLLFLLCLLVHQTYLFFGQLQMLGQRLGTPERVAAGVGSNLGPILRHPLQA
jgi:hypothetical protein